MTPMNTDTHAPVVINPALNCQVCGRKCVKIDGRWWHRKESTPMGTEEDVPLIPGTATREQIVWTWLDVLARRAVNLDSGIDVTADTYINGVPVHVDHDYYQGHLLEIVERDSGVVSYIAIAEFHGPKTIEDDGYIYLQSWDHDSMMYEPDCGTFFDRTEDAAPSTVGCWAVSVIHGMMENYADAQRRKR